MKKINKKIFIPIILLLLFIINTILVTTNKVTFIDKSIYGFIIKYSSEVTTTIMKIITFFGSTIWIVVLSILIFIMFLVLKQKDKSYKIAGSIILSTIINNIVKIIIRRPRPEYMTVVEKTFSYPSGHTMASTTLYGILLYLLLKSNLKKTYKIVFGIILGILPLLVGISRIYLGAHFFTDVFGGYLLSGLILTIIYYIDEIKKC
ncbi:MAG: phosphatase PAP2 family protein [bacterium]|nr:phosphatase PAP2 family protein [bacterium]